MATIGRVSGASLLNTPRLSYIATAAFNDYFYSYSTSLTASLDTVGTLSAVTGATAGNCPAGRVLRENGRKLYPGANPGIRTYMVGIYDPQTMLSGFVDPNAQVFQVYNTDKPTYLADGVEPTENTTDRGPSIYTRGDILGGSNLDISGAAHIYGNARVDGSLTIFGNQSTIGNVATEGSLNVSDTGTFGNTVEVTSGQIRASFQFQSTFGAGAAFVVNPTIGQLNNLDFSSNAPASMPITCTTFPIGAQLFFIFNNTSGSNRRYDFGAGFLSFGGGVNDVNAGTVASASYICDGVHFIQVGGGNPLGV